MGTPTKAERFDSHYKQIELAMDRGLNLFHRRGIVGASKSEHNIEHEVNAAFANSVFSQLETLECQYEFIMKDLPEGCIRDHIELILYTLGGDAYYMFAIYDRIKKCKVPVDVYIYGPCMSAGTIIAQAGRKRYIADEADYMVHYGFSGDQGTSHPQRIYEYARHEEDITNRMVEIYLSRANKQELAKDGAEHVRKDLLKLLKNKSKRRVNGLVAKMDQDELANKMMHAVMLSKESYYRPKDALRYGWVDGIIPEADFSQLVEG